MTQIIQSNAELERMAHDNATETVSFLSPDFPSFKGTKEAIKQEKEQEKEFTEDERRLEEEGVIVDFAKCKVRDVQDMIPLPEKLDPFTEALIGGVDPMAAHQAMSLSFPMIAFLGQNSRVLYGDGKLRWMCGITWQMGGSGCGKSLVLRSLEDIFLGKEIAEKNAAAKRAAEYTLLSEKERKETPKPRDKVFILDSIPTAIALTEQMQINGGGAIYISCSECGEFGKKIQTPYYSLVLDMMKKSYDGTGESFMHKASDRMLYVESMKICANIGGTFDAMYKILRHCDSDGTLSRGCVTILGERKDEETEGEYRAPSWTKEQLAILLEGAERLRNFNNTYREKQNENENKDDPFSAEVYERAHDSEGNIPTSAEYNFSVQEQRCKLALNVPAIVAFGRDIKRYLARTGEITDDCCSRANELAQAMCYLLYVANGLHQGPSGEASEDYDYNETLRCIFDVVRWWIYRSIDAAIAVQTNLNANSKSQREAIRKAYKLQVGESAGRYPYNEREEFFKQYEQEHAGEIVTVREVRDSSDILKRVVLRTVQRDLNERGWKEVARGKWRVPTIDR